jgi:hypothetical protein
MDNARAEKQQFLRINVIEAGYDSGAFIEYLDEQKGKNLEITILKPFL